MSMKLKDWTKTSDNDYGALTQEMYDNLAQGDRVRFKWHGSDRGYLGRIEIHPRGGKYWCPEHCYEGDAINPCFDNMQYYNTIDSFFMFTEFEVLKPDGTK